MSCLLDVNVLIALTDPSHIHRAVARDWFLKNRERGWATCPIIENGFLRVVTNPKYSSGPLSLVDAMLLIHRLKENPKYQFVADDISLTSTPIDLLPLGHQLITDYYLMELCRHHGLKLVTLDQRAKFVSQDLQDLIIEI